FLSGANRSPDFSMAQTAQTHAADCAHAAAEQCGLVDSVPVHPGISLGDRLPRLAISWDRPGISYSRTGGVIWNAEAAGIFGGNILRRCRSGRVCALPPLGILVSGGWLWICRIISHHRG